eukprot:TRINITY_DN1060_c0_g1_i1.p2 TRINITY_DN1060_c0_g1~~TRINITY_DN1060_c0_g1_i1.p2  ORF type:complete len:302 (+),score=19.45 TRINITY_DN1060_c0_g1_i1:121-1026(+)
MNNNSNSKQSLRKLAEELEDRWFLPQGAIHSFVRAHNNSVTMDNLRDFFTDLGLARLWETEGFNLFREYEVGGFVDMKTFMIELDNAHQISMASRLKQADALTRIEQDAANCDKFVGLVAHNEMNPVMLKFVEDNLEYFQQWPFVTTGSTGSALLRYLKIEVARQVASGPLGGDQQIGSMIADNKIAGLFFFTDPLNAHPHIDDVHALTRLCDVYQVPYATNRATALGVIQVLNNMGICWSLGEADVVSKYKLSQSKVIDNTSKRQASVQACHNAHIRKSIILPRQVNKSISIKRFSRLSA